MRKSIIFSNSELDVLEKRKQGIKKDTYSIFSNRLKPKMIELLGWFEKIEMFKQLTKGEIQKEVAAHIIESEEAIDDIKECNEEIVDNALCKHGPFIKSKKYLGYKYECEKCGIPSNSNKLKQKQPSLTFGISYSV